MTVRPHGLDLAAAAILRLCHDIGGAAGTVVNALDLAAATPAEDPSMAAEALGLAADAAREVAARISLARALWREDEPLTKDELRALAKGLPNAVRLQLDLDGLDPAPLPPASGQVLLAALIVAAEALHGPGAIAVAGGAASGITLCLAGLRAAWPDLLRDPPPETPGPRGIAPYLARLLAEAAGARLSFLLHTGTQDTPPPLLITFSP